MLFIFEAVTTGTHIEISALFGCAFKKKQSFSSFKRSGQDQA